jgi:hypothetical protein
MTVFTKPSNYPAKYDAEDNISKKEEFLENHLFSSIRNYIFSDK